MQKIKFPLPALLFLLFLIYSDLFCQSKGNIRGFVADSSNGEILAYSTIKVKGEKKGTLTDTRGYFFISSVSAGSQTLIISNVGYKTITMQIDIEKGKTVSLNIKMLPSSFRLGDISVLGEKTERPNDTDLGLDKITAKDIEITPVGIEADVLKTIQLSSGVSTTGDVTSQYFVRGGAGDQNLVLLNGAVLYNPFHSLGIYSSIDPEMISMVEFGERLSSIMNIVTRDGNKNEVHATANASVLSGKLSVESPIPHGSVLVTGRKSLYTKILQKYLNDKDTPFDFYDMSFKAKYANQNFIKDSKFIIHGFFTGDRLNSSDESMENFDVRNKILGFQWHQVWDAPVFSVFAVSYSGYSANVIPNVDVAKTRQNTVSDVSANWDFTYQYESRDELDFGVQSTFLKTDLNLTNLYGTRSALQRSGSQLRAYVNYKFVRFDNIGMESGARFNLKSISDKGPFLIEPRFSITYSPFHSLSFKAAFGRCSQEIVELSNEDELISLFEPWTILPTYMAPEEATHYSLGITNHFTENISIDIEGYYKKMYHLVEGNEKKYSPKDPDFEYVEGHSYGLESTIKYLDKQFNFKTSYSLGWALKTKNKIEYYPRYDVRHAVTIIAGWNFAENWQLNSTWSFKTGMPYTPIAGYYDRLEIDEETAGSNSPTFLPVIYWGDKNTQRLPCYHRLDIGITKKIKFRYFALSLGANIMNVYNRNNIFYFERDTGKRVNMLPLLPSVTVRFDY
jgi:hypothetical protein